MIINSKMVIKGGNGEKKLLVVPIENIKVDFPCILSIDGSTDNTGVGLIRESDGEVCASIGFERNNETPVAYKVRLKRAIKDFLEVNPCIKNIFYEEPFIGYASAAKNLLMLRVFIEEIIVENEPHFNYIKYREINNKKWKKSFLYPTKCPNNSDLEKKLVRDKLLNNMKFLCGISQDEIDAISMGLVAYKELKCGDGSSLQSKKAVRCFQYNVIFAGADDIDELDCLSSLDLTGVPGCVLENGIEFNEVSNRGDFDKQVYEIMGNEDKLLILKFSSKRYGNIILKHKIGDLASLYDNIYAIIWRKNRK